MFAYHSVTTSMLMGGSSVKVFYNNAAKIFGVEGVLCRRLEKLVRKVVYIACGSGCIITTSAWVYFLEKSFRVPKVVPKNYLFPT